MVDHEFHLMQLADSFFPSGMFGMSNGLEPHIKTSKIKKASDVHSFVRRQLKYQVLPCEGKLFSSAMDASKKRAISRLIELDNLCYSVRLVKEVRTASIRSGRQLLTCLVNMTDDRFAKEFFKKVGARESAGTYPICLAVAATVLHIPKKSAFRMMLYSYCVSIVGSAVRVGVISHIEGQRILTDLSNDVSSAKLSKDVGDLWQLAPLAEILQMKHEQEELRMFIT